eukprot:Hpha_TRINITY_DN30530_c0_g1::TRINITY_DN30530_c0_g1_i1::g.193680::m.193680/K17914/KIF13; kinesin family member 13
MTIRRTASAELPRQNSVSPLRRRRPAELTQLDRSRGRLDGSLSKTRTSLSDVGSVPASTPLGGSPRSSRKGGDGGSRSAVQVYVRVRPFNEREIQIQNELQPDEPLRSLVDIPDGSSGPLVLLDHENEHLPKEQFAFDQVLWSIPTEQQQLRDASDFATQEDVYSLVGTVALENAWQGYHTCVFAYGQTGAGKTHTMMGNFQCREGELEGEPGIVPRLCRALYGELEEKRRLEEAVGEGPVMGVRNLYELELSAFEIYNERVRDLFFMKRPGRQQKDELRVRWHPVEGPYVDDIARLQPKDWVECIAAVQESYANRTVGATAMNAESSRSHCVYQLKLTQVQRSVPQLPHEKPITNRRYSVISLVDLAGSERNKKSGAQGERLVEAVNINLSLTTLKRVMDALVQRKTNVPYRDSVLTKLLSHSLGGNSKTMMIAAVSPHFDNADETCNTLRYATNARKIVNVVRQNEDSLAKLKLKLIEEMQNMQDRLSAHGDGMSPDPEEVERLKRDIEVNQEELKRIQDQNQLLEERVEELQQRELELQRLRDKHHALHFRNTVRAIVLRKQKHAADLVVTQLEKTAAEESALRNARETEKDERVRSLDDRCKDLQKECRALEKKMEEMTEQHEENIKSVIDESGRMWDSFMQTFSDREGELLARLSESEKENEVLRRASVCGGSRAAAVLGAKLEEHERQLKAASDAQRMREEEIRRQSRLLRQEVEKEKDTEIKELRDELRRTRKRAEQAEFDLRHSKQAQSREHLAAEAAWEEERAELLARTVHEADRLPSKKKKVEEERERRAALDAARAEEQARSEAIVSSLQDKLVNAQLDAEKARAEVAEVREQAESLKRGMEEADRREQRLRLLGSELSRVLEAAELEPSVEAVAPALSPDAQSRGPLGKTLGLTLNGLSVSSVEKGGWGEINGVLPGLRLSAVGGTPATSSTEAETVWSSGVDPLVLSFTAGRVSRELQGIIQRAKHFQAELRSMPVRAAWHGLELAGTPWTAPSPDSASVSGYIGASPVRESSVRAGSTRASSRTGSPPVAGPRRGLPRQRVKPPKGPTHRRSET